MKKDIIINATSSEIRVALTEDNRLAELFLELPDKERHVGSIFMGRVERVVQGMNAAFVDIGLEQHAFLHFSDAANAGEDFSDLLTDDDDDEEPPSEKEQKNSKDERKGRDNSRGKGQKPQKNQDRRSGGNAQQDSGKQDGQKDDQESGKQNNKQRDNRRGGKKRPPGGQQKDDRDRNTQQKDRQQEQRPDNRKQDDPNAGKQENRGDDSAQSGEENQEQPKRRRPRPAPRGRHPRRRPPSDEKRPEENGGEQDNATVEKKDQEPARQEAGDKRTDAQASQEERPKKRPNRRRGGRSGSQKKEGQENSGNEKNDQSAKTAETSGQQPEDRKDSASSDDKQEGTRNEGSSRSGRSRSSRRKKSSPNKGETQNDQQNSGNAAKDSGNNREQKDATVKLEEKTERQEASADGKDTEKPKRRRPQRRKKKPQEDSAASAKEAPAQGGSEKKESGRKESGQKEASAPAPKKEEASSGAKASEDTKEGGSTTKRRKRPARKKPAAPKNDGPSDSSGESKSSGPKTMDAKLPTFQTKRHGEVTIALEKGQEILVQVTRESYASKGVKVSTKISLPGRFIVLLPLDPVVGISRKVMEVKERRRLRAIARKMLPEGFGCIIRTVAQDKDSEVLEQELQMLLDRWKSIEDNLKTASTPALLYKDQSVANTVMRDLFTPDVSRVLIDNKNLYTEIRDYVSWAAPALMDKVEHYPGRSPIFQHTGVEKELDKMLGAKVWLGTGGYIILEQTEAMMVIDVNSGRYAKDKEQEINALRTNLESAREIARQIRLRDIGGLIIVDFIDLYDEKNRKKVYDELKKEMSRDRAKSVVLPMTQFGLVQMTRQRVRQQLVQTMSEPCPTCNGKGIVQSKSTIARRMERWLSHFRSQTREFRLTVTANPQLIEFLTEGDSMSRLTKMMLRHFVRIKVVPDEALGIEQFRFFSVKRQEDITDEYMPK